MFRKGTYQFNREPNFNFQLNRVVMWGNGDPEEMLSVSEGITDSRSWFDALTSLARKAEEEGECRGRILLHGGNDSYIEEFYPMLRYFQEKGYDVYLFERPGQGGVLREQDMKFDLSGFF